MADNLSKVTRKIDQALPDEIRKSEITQRIESRTSKIPSALFLNLGLASVVLSAVLAIFRGRREEANFVGLWAPTFLLLGIYNKLVKIEDSDAMSKPDVRNRAA